MGYKLTLEVSEQIYEPLARAAQQSGQTPEELALEWLERGMQALHDDPLEEYIGGFASDLPDWTERVDEYLGRALLHESSEGSGAHA